MHLGQEFMPLHFYLFIYFFHSTGIPWSYTDAWAISKKSM